MLNNRGWGIQTMMVFSLILMIALIIVAAFGSKIFDVKPIDKPDTPTVKPEDPKPEVPVKKSYTNLENQVIEGTKKYYQKYYSSEFSEGDKIVVTVNNLVKQNMLTELKDIKDETIICSGYGTFIKENNEINYASYIKCGSKYTTKGYLERLDN